MITELRHWRFAPGGGDEGLGGGGQEIWVYKANYWYDEAGNRICKKTFIWQPSGAPNPNINNIEQIVEEGDNPTGTWNILETIYYLRDVTGKEIAIYSGNNVEQWNVYGLDQVGDIKSNGDKFFYLKDHLGTIRAVLDSNNSLVTAFDYDCWGYPLENRSYEPVNQRYKFTSKERDRESSLDGNGYDYFGARYYDSRIGRWGGVDSLFKKHYDFSPYNYTADNPLRYVDTDGKQWVEWIIKRAIIILFKKGTDMKDVGFGKKGEDIDGDGIMDNKDEIDNRTEEQKKWLEQFKKNLPDVEKEMKSKQLEMYNIEESKKEEQEINQKEKTEKEEKKIEPLIRYDNIPDQNN